MALVGMSVLGEWSWLLVAALASLTVLRSSIVQSALVASTGVDRTGPALLVGMVAFGGAVLLSSHRFGLSPSAPYAGA